MIVNSIIKCFKIIINIKNIIFAKSYGVGDSIPSNTKLSDQNSKEVDQAKRLLNILVLLENEKNIKKNKDI